MDNTSNFPQGATEYKAPRKDYRNAIIGVLAAGLMGVGGFMIADSKKSTETIQLQETKIAAVTEEKSVLQTNFDASLARLDSMSTANAGLQGKLKESNGEIARAKKEIRGILNKKNASAAELARAKDLIASLNSKIEGMEQEVARLTEENKTLIQEKTTLIADKEKLTADLTSTTEVKQNLEKKVDVASTLNASNIVITPINVKKNGKEKVSTVAKRVDKLVVSFDVNNRIAQPGMTDVYVLVIGPDGKPVTNEATGSGTFTTREDGEKSYTAKVQVDIETAKNKNVEFAFKPGVNFQQGSYKIMIYQNGFLIGEGVRQLKKGGLFS
jgi:predicted nuclease with TOPRIM domain